MLIMNNVSPRNQFDPSRSYIEVNLATGGSAMRRIDTTSTLLVDVVNPQPKSSQSFYARIKTVQQKQRVRRKPATATVEQQIMKDLEV